MAKTPQILDFIDHLTLDRFIHDFAAATGIAVDINDQDGHPVAAYRHFYGFCRKIRSTAEGLKRCYQSNARVGRKAAHARQPVLDRCHAGLMLMAAPIIVDGYHLGSIVGGQFHSHPPSPAEVETMLQNTNDLGLAPACLAKQYLAMVTVPPAKHMAACEILKLMAVYIEEIARKHPLPAKAGRNSQAERLVERVEPLQHHLLENTGERPEHTRLLPTADLPDTIQAACQLINTNYGRKIKLKDMARAAHLSPAYFCRLFKQCTGMSPTAYLTRVRLQAAMEMLRHSNLAIGKIAKQTGFSTPNYLSNVFRAQMGMSPLAYRKSFARSEPVPPTGLPRQSPCGEKKHCNGATRTGLLD